MTPGVVSAPQRTIAVAVTGASGAIYAVRTIAALLAQGCRLEVVFSDYGRRLMMDELGRDAKPDRLIDLLVGRYGDDVRRGTVVQHNNNDLGATLASGSHRCDAMVIVPCSMKTLAGVANGLSRSLIERAADVMLKERRRLVLVPRETPMSLPQLRNMVAVAEAGAMVLPAMPAFYQQPKSIDDLADFIAGKILNALGFEQTLFPAVGRLRVSKLNASAPIKVDKAPARIAGMFDAIAGRYDTLNHLLSAGIDRRWRRIAVEALALTGREQVLDLCTGTADLAIAAVTAPRGAARNVVGIDFAGGMLKLGLEKIRRASLSDRVQLARGDAEHVPLADASVDAAMIAFGIRNVADPGRGCAECHRVLRAGGRLAILEFGHPTLPGASRSRLVAFAERGLRAAYAWYFTAVLPRIGRLISKHGEAYEYLPASVEQFPAGEAFVKVLRQAGFEDVRAVPLTLGIVYLYVATKGSG